LADFEHDRFTEGFASEQPISFLESEMSMPLLSLSPKKSTLQALEKDTFSSKSPKSDNSLGLFSKFLDQKRAIHPVDKQAGALPLPGLSRRRSSRRSASRSISPKRRPLPPPGRAAVPPRIAPVKFEKVLSRIAPGKSAKQKLQQPLVKLEPKPQQRAPDMPGLKIGILSKASVSPNRPYPFVAVPSAALAPVPMNDEAPMKLKRLYSSKAQVMKTETHKGFPNKNLHLVVKRETAPSPRPEAMMSPFQSQLSMNSLLVCNEGSVGSWSS